MTADLDFSGRRVLVTGAAGGLGSAISALFAAQGASLVLADIDEARLVSLQDRLGVAAQLCVFDQADPASVLGLAKESGAVDVLVNNAGVMLLKPLLDLAPDELDRVFRVNAIGPMLLAQAVAKGMTARRSGVIVNVGSQLVFSGARLRGVYAAAKAALTQFTRTAAVEWAPCNVRVVCAAPGRTVTPMNEETLREEGAAGVSRIPLGRYGSPAEAAKLVVFLASSAAAYITGETVVADGGFVLS